jgi:hypothetical protein
MAGCDEQACVVEALPAFKLLGQIAFLIYFARDAARYLKT